MLLNLMNPEYMVGSVYGKNTVIPYAIGHFFGGFNFELNFRYL